MPTKIIDNFAGRLTRDSIGDMNSGLAKFVMTAGNDPFSNPGNLTWFERAIQIDAGATVITDLIMAARPRLEGGITYVYAIGHTGRLYKIQVNKPSTHDPNYDTPVLLTTLTSNSPTFKYGSSIQFYGATERLYIGHDIGVTRVDFDGTNETFIGVAGSYTANVPRPSVNFLGVSYWGNGTNVVAIDSTAAVTTYAKLSPAFPVGTYVRDLDVSPDGNYLQIIVSRIPPSDLTSTTQDTNSLSSGDSYKFLWNGSDDGYTSYESYNAYSINSNISFGPYSYIMGYDLGGGAIYTNGNKIITLPTTNSPNFGAMFSTGNMLGFGTVEQVAPFLEPTILMYGQYDQETSKGLFRLLRTAVGTDTFQMPVCLVVSNLFYGASTAGYTNNQVGAAKLYYSILSLNSGTPTYSFWKFTTAPTGLGTTIGGIYETQQETSLKLFRSIITRKFKPTQVRFYVEPLVANNAFTIEIIGSNGNVIPGSGATFTVGTNASVGQDYVWYTPQTAPTYSMGVRITNSGTANWTGAKLEIDYDEAGI